MSLTESYRRTLRHIETTGCVWVQNTHNDKWYHTYHRPTVDMRKAHLRALIERRETYGS